jgi:hypothetical protein
LEERKGRKKRKKRDSCMACRFVVKLGQGNMRVLGFEGDIGKVGSLGMRTGLKKV